VRKCLYLSAAFILTGTLLWMAAPLIAVSQDAQDAPQPSFAEWLSGVRAEALARGIRSEIIDQAFAGLDEPLALPMERDRAQPEATQTIEQYISRHAGPAAIRRGRAAMQQNRALLGRVSRAYGVPAPVLVAVWGVESNYGRFSGVQPTIPVLTTLAWDPRRAGFFRQELFGALDILNRGDIEIEQMHGSWAGAMGQPQFMPSSYLSYAVDFDGDGRRDIWTSPADILASIGNYLKQHGWQQDKRWGREVAIPRGSKIDVPAREGGCGAMRAMTVPLPLDQWRALGVKLAGGSALPKADFPASLTSGTRRHFLVYDNYEVLLSYNCAHAYALSVALLSDRLGP
jgi:membrane-bound lytic murein transglycosylase B